MRRRMGRTRPLLPRHEWPGRSSRSSRTVGRRGRWCARCWRRASMRGRWPPAVPSWARGWCGARCWNWRARHSRARRWAKPKCSPRRAPSGVPWRPPSPPGPPGREAPARLQAKSPATKARERSLQTKSPAAPETLARLPAPEARARLPRGATCHHPRHLAGSTRRSCPKRRKSSQNTYRTPRRTSRGAWYRAGTGRAPSSGVSCAPWVITCESRRLKASSWKDITSLRVTR